MKQYNTIVTVWQRKSDTTGHTVVPPILPAGAYKLVATLPLIEFYKSASATIDEAVDTLIKFCDAKLQINLMTLPNFTYIGEDDNRYILSVIPASCNIDGIPTRPIAGERDYKLAITKVPPCEKQK